MEAKTFKIKVTIEDETFRDEYTPTLEEAIEWDATEEKHSFVCDTAGTLAHQHNLVASIEAEYTRILKQNAIDKFIELSEIVEASLEPSSRELFNHHMIRAISAIDDDHNRNNGELS